MFARGDVGKGDDHPFDAVVLCPIGQDAAGVPGAVLGLDLARERHEIGKHGLGVDEQIRIGEMVREIGERPADVGGDHAEERLRRGGEEADLEFLVEEQRRNVGAVQDVLEVVGEGLMLVEGLLKLAVERRELLVERLQFLL